ncbi:MAG: double-stranded DNA-binding protein [Nitrosarchaeum sp.]|nr:double-stranded DNA-binding protein [Nitrosarchaeum sp.]MBP0119654.1 double-stranded DNA-binding protein [Nitrosarchaeum sp.]MBP0134333.1 double-stranded DNA-binding protein [Nitrosarchaeum sp.]
MSSDDSELERLKAKRLAEMQQNISTRQEIEKTPDNLQPKETKHPRDILIEHLGFRGLEVLQNAELQFQNDTKTVVEKLAELITSGEITEIIDGGKLLMLFRSIGLNIRMETKINIEKDGKFVSLSDKLSNYSSDVEE